MVRVKDAHVSMCRLRIISHGVLPAKCHKENEELLTFLRDDGRMQWLCCIMVCFRTKNRGRIYFATFGAHAGKVCHRLIASLKFDTLT